MRNTTLQLSKCCAIAASTIYFALSVCTAVAQQNQPRNIAEKQTVYLIGNSLTWDTLPGLLDGDAMWHVDCGKNLEYIYENPSKPCVRTSVPWTKALREHQFEYLCVQPHFGTTVDRDSEIISKWVEMQPNAKLVIHTGWTHHRSIADHYHADCSDKKMRHSPAYFDMLSERLRKRFPKLEIRSTGATSVMHEICQDISKQEAPIASIDALYRDDIHVTTGAGRYLMHNLMRISLDQKVSQQGFQVEEPLRSYLTSKLEAVGSRATRLTARRD